MSSVTRALKLIVMRKSNWSPGRCKAQFFGRFSNSKVRSEVRRCPSFRPANWGRSFEEFWQLFSNPFLPRWFLAIVSRRVCLRLRKYFWKYFCSDQNLKLLTKSMIFGSSRQLGNLKTKRGLTYFFVKYK